MLRRREKKGASGLYRNCFIPSGIMSKHNFSLKLTWHDHCHIQQQKHKLLSYEFAGSCSNINDLRPAQGKRFVGILSFHIHCIVKTPRQIIISDFNLHMGVQLHLRAGLGGCSRLLPHPITPVCRNKHCLKPEKANQIENLNDLKSQIQPVHRDNDSAASTVE